MPERERMSTLLIDGKIRSDEDRQPIDVGFIGCGSHAFRNIYPTLQFADVNLVATCDLNERKAELYATQFGAERSYGEYQTMLERESLDGVLVVLNYDDEGRPKYPDVAADVLRAGCDVWIEKPPAASVSEIEELCSIESETGQFVEVGFKKCFAPAIEKTREIIDTDEFGRLNSLSVRYPQQLPVREDRNETLVHDQSLVVLLDHIAHPGSIVSYLGGAIESVRYQSSVDGGGFISLRFENGAVGSIHMASGSSGSSPLERVEAVGNGANVVVENGVDLTYYRPCSRPAYGTATTFTGSSDDAPVSWKPEFSLGQLNNKNLFTLGYYNEIQHFAECCRTGETPEKGGLQMAMEVTRLYEALLEPEDEVVAL